jgi:hypothetical protein
MSAFSVAMTALFTDRNMATVAVYMPQGSVPHQSVSVIISRPDEARDYGESRILVDTISIDVRQSEVPTPRDCDVYVINGRVYLQQGEAVEDTLQLIWTLGLVPA